MDGTVPLDHYFAEYRRVRLHYKTTHVTWNHVNVQGLVSHAGDFQYPGFHLSNDGKGTILTRHSALDISGISAVEQ